MHETPADLRELQRVLDESYAAAGEHLRSVFTPERRMSAPELVELLRGVFVLDVATVTAACEPMVAPVDGLFYRGKLLFGFPPGAVRARHLRARPQVSAVYHQGEDTCVVAHGRAHEIDIDAPEHADVLGFYREVYGASLDYWREERYGDREGAELNAWIVPRRMFALKPAS